MRAECFKCKRNYRSTDPEDEGGDFFCPSCTKEAKAIALKIDEDFAKRPPKKKIPKMQPWQKSADGHLEIYNARQFI